MVSGTPGAADLEFLRTLFAHRPGAWDEFVRRHRNDVYRPCRLIFSAQHADEVFVDVMRQLCANDCALLREFDGRASLSAYLRLVMRDLLYPQVARLLTEQPERGWLAFEHFFKRDIERTIARQFPGAAETGRDQDLYHEVASALIEDNYRRLQAYKGEGSFGGYVLSIVRNLCIDLLRKEMPRRRLPAAIKRLSEFEQEVFRQLYWEHCTPEQLATTLRAKGFAVDDPEVVAKAVMGVKAALPANFKAGGGDDERPRAVPLPGSGEVDAGSAELADDRPTPEDEVIDRQNEAVWQQACAALKAVIAGQPPETRLYLEYVMSKDPPLAPRIIAQLMGRPVAEIYALRQQTERILRQALRDNPAIKNLSVSV
jgi:RNA polymerase primary sigma factor